LRENKPPGIKPKLLVRPGEPIGVIVKVANELGTDLIVMATHAHQGFARLLLGSVAERVMREARPAVLTMRPEITVQPRSAEVSRDPLARRLFGSAGLYDPCR
jgi:hypothetical protein